MTDTGATGTIAEPRLRPSELFHLLVKCIRAHYPVLIVGAPGIGKTSIVKQVASHLSCKLQINHPIVDAPIDYRGHPYAWIDKKGIVSAEFVPYGNLKELIDVKELMICLADDLGQATDTVKAAWMQLQLGRQINNHKISDQVVFVACSNRKEDAAGVTRFLEPLKDRYHTIIELCSSVEDWIDWALKEGLNHEVVTWIRMNPQFLNNFKPASDFSRTCTPRSIHQLSDMFSLGFDPRIQLRTFSGIVGTEASVNFMAHLTFYSKIEDPDRVITNPKKAKIPDDPALLYALCGSLAAKANRKNIANIIEFANRIETEAQRGEFSVLLVGDAAKKNANEIMTTDAFIQWATDHQGVLSI